MIKIKNNTLNWTLNVVARWVVGCVFLFSAFVKGVDPLGTSFKITEYMTAWSVGSLTFEWAVPMATTISFVLIIVEFSVGVMLVTGSFRRFSAWLLAAMMLFFTCTTLVDALTNKVTDCGCFGDAVKLTNWQTFWKNVVLDVPMVWILMTKNLRCRRRFERDILIMGFAAIAMLIFGLYNIKHEPVIDFRSWKVGNQMIDLDPSLEVRSFVTYRNTTTGEEKEFASEQLVEKMADPTWEQQWEWVSSRVIDPHEIKADGFSMLDSEMTDHAQELIGSADSLVIITVHHLDRVDADGLDAIRAMVEYAEENAVQTVLLTAALPEEVEVFLLENGLGFLEYYFADATAIETMARSNPGFVLMRGGKVLDKMHYREVNREK